MMENVFEILKDLPKPGDYVLLTVAKGSAAGEKAILAEKKIIWESKENGFFSAHFSEAGDLKKCGLYEIREQQVFCDIIGGQEHLVICGGGHVSVPVIKIGIMLGWKVTVLEDRPQFADHARNAGATEVICQPFEDALDQIEGDKDTYFVVLTRGHRYDQVCLEKIVGKEHAYIGMIGSRRRSAMVKQNLIEKGCSQEVIGEIKSPIGLNIGAETPEEIGVAIMAEIIEVKNQNKSLRLSERLAGSNLGYRSSGKEDACNDHYKKGFCTKECGIQDADPGRRQLCWNHRRRLYGGRGFKKSESHDA